MDLCNELNIEIRKIKSDEVEQAMELALEVFMQFETLKKDIIENEEYLENAKRGICPIYGAFEGNKLVSIIGMRSNKTHFNLVFTKKEYHRKGIATKVFNYLLEDLLCENPSLKEITLNSSPYGVPFYLHIGFKPLTEEQEMNGIKFTPMKYIIER